MTSSLLAQSRSRQASHSWAKTQRLAAAYGSVLIFGALLSFGVTSNKAQAQSVDIASVPMLALKSNPGLVMLTMSRDHRLFYMAYDDASDLDGDGLLDVGYKPTLDYYGNFESDRCYTYANSKFTPVSISPSRATGCSGQWYGNWLNWATTVRIDILRRVLYGGSRINEVSTGVTTIRGAFLPNDSHVLGKEFRRKADGTFPYDITKYTPLSAPAAGKQHVFTVVGPSAYQTSAYRFSSAATKGASEFKYITDADANLERAYFWAAADGNANIGSDNANFCVSGTCASGQRNSVRSTRLLLNVDTCVPIGGVRDESCVEYKPTASTTVWKPTGLIQSYGAKNALKFGLITGSYSHNFSGGILRKPVTDYVNTTDTNVEINKSTGAFLSNSVASQIDKITIYGWNGSNSRYETPGSTNECSGGFTALPGQGRCVSWGAPIAEMMYEALRYFSGKTAPSSAFGVTTVNNSGSADRNLGFPTAPTSWTNPISAASPTPAGSFPKCSRPIQMVIADPTTSFDGDQLPGRDTTTFANDFTLTGGAINAATDDIGFVAATRVDEVWSKLGYANPSRFFIGQSGSDTSGGVGNPTLKDITKFSNIRGIAPDGAQAQGTYHAAGVAYFGKYIKLLNSELSSQRELTVDTYSIALGSVVPKIEFETTQGRKVSILPMSKSVGGFGGISASAAAFQPTGAITGFYVLSMANIHRGGTNLNPNSAINSGLPYMQFAVNFSDTDQGNDNETDALVTYTVRQNAAGQVIINMSPAFVGATKKAFIEMHMGYVISGVQKAGMYLDMRSITGDSAQTSLQNTGIKYYLDTPPETASVPNSIGACNPTTKTSCTALPVGMMNRSGYSTSISAYNTTNAQLNPTARTFTPSAVSTDSGYMPQNALWYAAKYGSGEEKIDGSVKTIEPSVDVNGVPTNYFEAANPSELPEKMESAFGNAAGLAAVASTSVVGKGQRSQGTAAVYQAIYDSLTWSSRVYAFSVKDDGQLQPTPVWEAASVLPSTRKMYLGQTDASNNRAAPVDLAATSYASLTAALQTSFVDANVYDYLIRGNRNLEQRNGGKFRNRGSRSALNSDGTPDLGSLLGDIVNSDPQVIGKRDFGYGSASNPDSTYTAFVDGLGNEFLAMGSNNGFFHIFDATAKPDSCSASDATASCGKELLAYMPQEAVQYVAELAKPSYKHRFFVDGPVGYGHAKVALPGDASARWRTMVVGTGGAGLRTVFAIDMPQNDSKVFTGNHVLWEINPNTIRDATGTSLSNNLGNVFDRPKIGKLKNGTWVAIFGNGFNSTAGLARLFVVRLTDGRVLKSMAASDAVTGNGISTTAVTYTDEKAIEYVYASDVKGNIWRFDPNTNSTAARIFTTPAGQSITAEIVLGDPPSGSSSQVKGGKMIYFGTGKYLGANDTSDVTVQALYGIYDEQATTSSAVASVTMANLAAQSIQPYSSTSDVRSTSATEDKDAWYTKKGQQGWRLPLTGAGTAPGERVIAPAVIFGDALIFTSIVPGTDPCKAGVDTWLTALNALSGGAEKYVFPTASPNNSVKIAGGSPRGVFVLDDNSSPILYTTRTILDSGDNTANQTSFSTSSTRTCQSIGGQAGCTETVGLKLCRPKDKKCLCDNKLLPVEECKEDTPTGQARGDGWQIWRQIK